MTVHLISASSVQQLLPPPKPFVKWVGGKRCLIDKISEFLPASINTYHEPFVGGGAIFFAHCHRFKRAVLADLNKELMTAYQVIATRRIELCSVLLEHQRKYQLGNGYYYKIRSKTYSCPVKIAARLIFLNKTCFNGLYRVNKNGIFNAAEGSYKNPKICDAKNLAAVENALIGAEIRSGAFINTVHPQEGDFIYCDPPYYGTYANYQAVRFAQSEHLQLKLKIDEWSAKGVRVLLSNADNPFIKDLYKGYRQATIQSTLRVNCDGNGRGKVRELIIRNYTT